MALPPVRGGASFVVQRISVMKHDRRKRWWTPLVWLMIVAWSLSAPLSGVWAGKTVHVRADNVRLAVAPMPSRTLLARTGEAIGGLLGGLFGVRKAHAATASRSYVTDSRGRFTVRLEDADRPVTLHVRAGENEQMPSSPLTLSVSGDGGTFTDSQTITITAKLTIGGQEVSVDSVTWTTLSSHVSCAAWNRDTSHCNGLTWGSSPVSLSSSAEADKTSPDGQAPTGAEASLTDIVGQRTVKVQATVTHDGKTYAAETDVTFGSGPLAVFAGPPKGRMTWANAVSACEGESYKLPSMEQLQAVSGYTGKGAAFFANWMQGDAGFTTYWIGETDDDGGDARFVYLIDGSAYPFWVELEYPVAVCIK